MQETLKNCLLCNNFYSKSQRESRLTVLAKPEQARPEGVIFMNTPFIQRCMFRPLVCTFVVLVATCDHSSQCPERLATSKFSDAFLSRHQAQRQTHSGCYARLKKVIYSIWRLDYFGVDLSQFRVCSHVKTSEKTLLFCTNYLSLLYRNITGSFSALNDAKSDMQSYCLICVFCFCFFYICLYLSLYENISDL